MRQTVLVGLCGVAVAGLTLVIAGPGGRQAADLSPASRMATNDFAAAGPVRTVAAPGEPAGPPARPGPSTSPDASGRADFTLLTEAGKPLAVFLLGEDSTRPGTALVREPDGKSTNHVLQGFSKRLGTPLLAPTLHGNVAIVSYEAAGGGNSWLDQWTLFAISGEKVAVQSMGLWSAHLAQQDQDTQIDFELAPTASGGLGGELVLKFTFTRTDTYTTKTVDGLVTLKPAKGVAALQPKESQDASACIALLDEKPAADWAGDCLATICPELMAQYRAAKTNKAKADLIGRIREAVESYFAEQPEKDIRT